MILRITKILNPRKQTLPITLKIIRNHIKTTKQYNTLVIYKPFPPHKKKAERKALNQSFPPHNNFAVKEVYSQASKVSLTPKHPVPMRPQNHSSAASTIITKTPKSKSVLQ